MTLLSRNPRSKSTHQSQNPGPGYYQPLKNNQMHAAAPFGSTSKRFNLNRNFSQQSNPSPGQYTNNKNIISQKVLMHMEAGQQQIDIIQYPKPSSNFKSTTRRFQNLINTVNPGPGSYFGFGQKKKSAMKATQKVKTNALKKYIKNFRQQENKIANEQAIPFKRMKIERYNQLNKNQIISYPHKIHPQHFFNSNVPRIKLQRPRTSVGPGQYQLNNVPQQKNIIVNKVLRQQKVQKQQTSEYPGFYYNQQSMSSFSNNRRTFGIECFGTTACRFSYEKKYKQQAFLPGPGYYYSEGYIYKKIDNKKVDNKKKDKLKIGFGSKQKRNNLFDQDLHSTVQASDNCEKNMNLFNNQHKSVKNKPTISFGSKVSRFASLNQQNIHQIDQIVQQKKDFNFDLKANNLNQGEHKKEKHSLNLSDIRNKGLNFNTRLKGSTVSKKQDQNQYLKMLRKQKCSTPICYDCSTKIISKKTRKNQCLGLSHSLSKGHAHEKFTLFLNKNGKAGNQQELGKMKGRESQTSSIIKEKQGSLLRVSSQVTAKEFKKRVLGEQRIENILKIRYNSQLMKQKQTKQNWSHQPRDPFKPKENSANICPGQYNAQLISKKSFNKLCLR